MRLDLNAQPQTLAAAESHCRTTTSMIYERIVCTGSCISTFELLVRLHFVWKRLGIASKQWNRVFYVNRSLFSKRTSRFLNQNCSLPVQCSIHTVLSVAFVHRVQKLTVEAKVMHAMCCTVHKSTHSSSLSVWAVFQRTVRVFTRTSQYIEYPDVLYWMVYLVFDSVHHRLWDW